MAMPQCCYLAKGAKRPSHTTNMQTFSNKSSFYILAVTTLKASNLNSAVWDRIFIFCCMNRPRFLYWLNDSDMAETNHWSSKVTSFLHLGHYENVNIADYVWRILHENVDCHVKRQQDFESDQFLTRQSFVPSTC